MKKLLLILSIIICISQNILLGQTPVLGFDTINSPVQDIPMVVNRMYDGSFLLAARQKPYMGHGKAKLLLIKMNEDGTPIRNENIEIDTFSIQQVGGVFQTGVNEFTIFCTFDSSFLFTDRSIHFGYLKTDTLFNVTYIKKEPIPLRPKATDGLLYDIRVKHWENSRFYGVLGMNDNAAGFSQTSAIYFVTDIDLNQTIYNHDTVSRLFIISRGDTIDERILGGTTADMHITHDNQYFIKMHVGRTGDQLIYKMKISDSIHTFLPLGGMGPISVDSYHFFSFTWRANIKTYKNNNLLVAGAGKYETYNYTSIDTISSLPDAQQSFISIYPVNDSTMQYFVPSPVRYRLIENLQNRQTDTITHRFFYDVYGSALSQCVDFYDENKIYYARQIGEYVQLYRTGNFNCILLISQFDSTLKKNWERRITTNTREGTVSINATSDGGALLITRKYNGAQFDSLVNGTYGTFDIAVYKFNKHGVITSTKQINSPTIQPKYTLYPNPAINQIHIQGNNPISAIQVWDAQGKQYAVQWDTMQQQANINALPTGIYYIQLLNKTSEILQVIRLVKE